MLSKNDITQQSRHQQHILLSINHTWQLIMVNKAKVGYSVKILQHVKLKLVL